MSLEEAIRQNTELVAKQNDLLFNLIAVLGQSRGATWVSSTTTSEPIAAPVAATPVTAAPVTAAPVTAAPVTAAPVTAAPVTAAPVTAAPVTLADLQSAAIKIIQASPAKQDDIKAGLTRLFGVERLSKLGEDRFAEAMQFLKSLTPAS